MPQLYVAFDTAMYRGLSDSRFQRIHERERNHSVVGACSRWVVGELLAHAADETDPAFKPALAALGRLAPHCRTYNGSHYVLPLIADVEDQIAYAFLRKRTRSMDGLSAYLAELVGVIIERPGESKAFPYKAMLQGVADDVRRAEEEFVSNIWRNIHLSSVPDADGWDVFIKQPKVRQEVLAEIESLDAERTGATIWLELACKRLGLALSAEQREATAANIHNDIPGAIKLQNELIAGIVRDGVDLRKAKHRNTLWDLHTAITTTAFARLNHSPLWLVTEDRGILRAAARTGNGDIVHSLTAYEQRLAQADLF